MKKIYIADRGFTGNIITHLRGVYWLIKWLSSLVSLAFTHILNRLVWLVFVSNRS